MGFQPLHFKREERKRESTPGTARRNRAVKSLSHGERLQRASTRGSQEETGWFRARQSGKENAEYRTNAAQGLQVLGKNTQ